jgi:ribosomal protein S18 acetylase RimI-like enzyme
MNRKGYFMTIRRYELHDETALFSLLEREGDEWQDYWKGDNRKKFTRALAGSIVYLIFDGKTLCGYARCRDDDGYGVYVYDLLVDKTHRGKEYGRLLMEQIYRDYSDVPVYVMSDVNPYYEKLGYEVEGSIFVVKPRDVE